MRQSDDKPVTVSRSIDSNQPFKLEVKLQDLENTFKLKYQNIELAVNELTNAMTNLSNAKFDLQQSISNDTDRPTDVIMFNYLNNNSVNQVEKATPTNKITDRGLASSPDQADFKTLKYIKQSALNKQSRTIEEEENELNRSAFDM